MNHLFTYVDNSNGGKIIAVITAPGILIADEKLNKNFLLNPKKGVEYRANIGCRIKFAHCHSDTCRKENFTPTSCDCGFTAAHIASEKIRERLKTRNFTPLYKAELVPASEMLLQDINAILEDCRKRAAEAILNPEDMQ